VVRIPGSTQARRKGQCSRRCALSLADRCRLYVPPNHCFSVALKIV